MSRSRPALSSLRCASSRSAPVGSREARCSRQLVWAMPASGSPCQRCTRAVAPYRLSRARVRLRLPINDQGQARSPMKSSSSDRGRDPICSSCVSMSAIWRPGTGIQGSLASPTPLTALLYLGCDLDGSLQGREPRLTAHHRGLALLDAGQKSENLRFECIPGLENALLDTDRQLSGSRVAGPLANHGHDL